MTPVVLWYIFFKWQKVVDVEGFTKYIGNVTKQYFLFLTRITLLCGHIQNILFLKSFSPSSIFLLSDR